MFKNQIVLPDILYYVYIFIYGKKMYIKMGNELPLKDYVQLSSNASIMLNTIKWFCLHSTTPKPLNFT